MRVTGPLIRVLQAFLEQPGTDLYGLELLRMTRLKSGTVYPILDRLEARGWLESRWEEEGTARRAGPRRRFYKLTGTGAHEGRQILIEYGIGGGGAWIST